MKALGIAITTLLTFFMGPVVSGWALSILWGWFVHPVFTTVPALSAVDGMGLGILARFILGWAHAKRPDNDDRSLKTVIFESVAWIVMYNGLFLGFGWVFHLLRG